MNAFSLKQSIIALDRRKLNLLKAIPLLLLLLGGIAHSACAQYKHHFVVAKDGSGDFKTIQAAIDASKSFPYKRITIYIKNGVYHEKVRVPEWNPKITLVGQSKDKTIITYGDYFKKVNRGRNSTFFTWTLLVRGNDFVAKNLTIKNSAGPVGQAIALSVEADKAHFENCRFLGNQDTIYLSGVGFRQYFHDCYIEGTTDFIFGQGTALFKDCTIHSKANSYVTAASTPKNIKYGFVFKNCKLTAASGVNKVYLGRPWRKYAKVAYINCWLGNQIRPQGWSKWDNSTAVDSIFYAVYKNRGPGANPRKRASWTHQLTKKQAKNYTMKKILGNWKPSTNSSQ